MPAPIADATPNGRPGRNPTVRADPLREYTAGGARSPAIGQIYETLPPYIDDIQQSVGQDTYERMLSDAGVASCVTILKCGVLAQDLKVTPARKEGEEDYERATDLAAFCERNVNRLTNFRTHTLYNMLDATCFGHSVAEVVYEIAAEGQDAGQLVLSRLKVKPRKQFAFVVDAYMNVIGLQTLQPGKVSTLGRGPVTDPRDLPGLLPRRKFAILTHRPQNEDPRGTSLLRAAYNAWWLKIQQWPEYLKNLMQFASPSVWGTTAENQQAVPELDAAGAPVLDAGGNPQYLTAEEVLLSRLIQWRNGTAMALPFGSEIHIAEPFGLSQPFVQAIISFDQQITLAILCQELATREGQHQSRAAATVHQDILGLVIEHARSLVEEMIENDLFGPLVEFNYGREMLELLPSCTLGDVEGQDFAVMAKAVADLDKAGYLTPSQKPVLDAMLGFPRRTPEEVAADVAEPAAEDGGAGSGGEEGAPP